MAVLATYSTGNDVRTQPTLYLGGVVPARAESDCPRCRGRIAVGDRQVHVVVPDTWSGWLHEGCAGPAGRS